ncbi:MAG: glycerate kinase [Candidatus Brocadiia bacterium]
MDKRARRDLLAIFEAGLAAADPAEAVRRHVVRRGRKLWLGDYSCDLAKVRNIFVVGAGKASAQMAGALEEILGERIAGGWINIKSGGGVEKTPLRRIHVHEAGHPVPDEAGLRGAREIVKILESAGEGDLVLLCLSGGGSALMPLPVAGVSLADKQAVTQALLACGADIREINTVRKHLSQLKGGRFAQAAQPAEVVALILSDVVGDPLDAIASGPSAPDSTTFADALAVLSKYGIESRAPRSVLEHLRAGAAGAEPETPKPGDPIFAKVRNLVIANNAASVAACARKSRALGYRPLVLSSTIEGEAREVARVCAAIARESLASGRPVAPPACLICGGETTVTLRGTGRGGRNQEFALAAALAARGLEGVAILAGGTDGTDGPTDAAGALADGATCDRAAGLGLSAADFLARNDSYHFFQPLGDLLMTGPTGTNVMDLYLLLVGRPKRNPR